MVWYYSHQKKIEQLNTWKFCGKHHHHSGNTVPSFWGEMIPLKIPGKLTVCELENGPLLVDLPIKMVIFHSYDQKLHAAVAQSAFPSKNAKHTAGSEHFWKLSCRKNVCGCAAKTCPRQHAKSTTGSNRFWTLSSRSCGVKHMSKSKNTCLHHFWMLKRCSS